MAENYLDHDGNGKLSDRFSKAGYLRISYLCLEMPGDSEKNYVCLP